MTTATIHRGVKVGSSWYDGEISGTIHAGRVVELAVIVNGHRMPLADVARRDELEEALIEQAESDACGTAGSEGKVVRYGRHDKDSMDRRSSPAPDAGGVEGLICNASRT